LKADKKGGGGGGEGRRKRGGKMTSFLDLYPNGKIRKKRGKKREKRKGGRW